MITSLYYYCRREHLTPEQVKHWEELSKKVENGDITQELAKVCVTDEYACIMHVHVYTCTCIMHVHVYTCTCIIHVFIYTCVCICIRMMKERVIKR